MKTQQRCDEVDERRLIGNLGGAEQAGAGDVPLPVVCRDSPPVVAASLSTTKKRRRGEEGSVVEDFETYLMPADELQP